MPRFAIVEEKTIEGPEGSAQDPKNVQAGEAVDQTHIVLRFWGIISMRIQRRKNSVSSRAVDLDPHGSAFIFPPGSGSRRVNWSTKKRKNASKFAQDPLFLTF